MSEQRDEEQLFSEVLARAGLGPEARRTEAIRALLVELWAFRGSDAPPWQVEMRTVEALGGDGLGRSPRDLVREVLNVGRDLADSAHVEHLLSDADARRLALFVDEAAARVAGARERAAATRRDEWLSFLSHQLKNPLNTITTTVWLLRNGRDVPIADRLAPIERALDRMLALVKDVRELNERTEQPVPEAFARRYSGSPGSSSQS